MHTVVNIYKPLGATPLETIKLLKKQNNKYKNLPITYAGRLDPLAHGVLLLVVDEAIADKNTYIGLSKVYEFEVLLGVSTDTYDMLGLVKLKQIHLDIKYVNIIVNSFVMEALNKTKQQYPPFSSKTVNGKPLFQWAKEGRLSEIQIPERSIAITDFQIVKNTTITKEDLEKRVLKQISLVNGDFRQEDIRKSWTKFLRQTDKESFQVIKFRIACSSGTYIRGLAHELGEQLGTGAIALDILRTQVGEYKLSEALKLND